MMAMALTKRPQTVTQTISYSNSSQTMMGLKSQQSTMPPREKETRTQITKMKLTGVFQRTCATQSTSQSSKASIQTFGIACKQWTINFMSSDLFSMERCPSISEYFWRRSAKRLKKGSNKRKCCMRRKWMQWAQSIRGRWTWLNKRTYS